MAFRPCVGMDGTYGGDFLPACGAGSEASFNLHIDTLIDTELLI